MAEDSPTHEAMRRATVGNTDGQPHAGVLAIQYRNIDALIPYVNNARTHSDEQVAQIAASIKEFGWTNPVLVDGDNGIIAGHGRIQAARKLGLTQIPIIELEGLSEAQRRAYILADNRLAENSTWNLALLELELSGLQADDFDITGLGFQDWEFQGTSFLEDFPDGEAPAFEAEPGLENEGALSNVILAMRSEERAVLDQAIRLVRTRNPNIETVVHSVIEMARSYSANYISEG